MIEHLLAVIGLWSVFGWVYRTFITDPSYNKHWTEE